MAAPTLSGLDAATFVRNFVNTVQIWPRVIDSDVTFGDADNDFTGAKLTISGLLPEDRVTLADNAFIDFLGGAFNTVYYDADGAGPGARVAVGTATGGVGANFVVTFNAGATAAAIEAVIENLIYSTVSANPTLTRNFTVTFWDAALNTVSQTIPVTVSEAAFNSAPRLTGLDAPTFAENTVNATPQIIDGDVMFTDADNDYDGGTLTVGGLLAEDRVSVAGDATIQFVAGDVFYDADGAGAGGAVLIGAATGGVGGDFVVTFNAAATAASIEALIEHLTYANVSDSPTATRDLTFSIVDAGGKDLGDNSIYVTRTGADDPFDGMLLGEYAIFSAPQFADIDGDGDLDVVLGEYNTGTHYFENIGTATAAEYVERTGVDNPFAAATMGFSKVTLGDLDDDGDLDAVFGDIDGDLIYMENLGSATDPNYLFASGPGSPLAGLEYPDLGSAFTVPTLVDLDDDGDLDLFSGWLYGEITYWENTGTASAAVFTLNPAANPFADAYGGLNTFSSIQFADLDGDGDFDAVLSDVSFAPRYFENIGTASAPAFLERFGADNRVLGVGARELSFGDIDGDGDLDVIGGGILYGGVVFMENVAAATQTLTVTVTAEEDPILGTGGADTLSGTPGDDVIDGLAGDDSLNGKAADDTLYGGEGDDRLEGGDGVDTMYGGTGDDTYVVENAGDVTDETGGDGVDLVWSRVTWTLGADIENLTLGAGGGEIDGYGNELNNVITGNTYANKLQGWAGDDTVIGGGGADELSGNLGEDVLDGGAGDDFLDGGDQDDTLIGGAGHDYLRGGAGVDVMTGGAGNDTYVVGDENDVTDETGGSGRDLVRSSISWTLAAGVEDLILGSPSGASTGTGNALGNEITGTIYNNVLTGLGGNDHLMGLHGSDVLDGGTGSDTLEGGAGGDMLSGGDGVDILTGDDSDDLLYGGANADDLVGGSGNDLLDGGSGGDDMVGGEGHDTYIVDSVADTVLELAGGGSDTIQTTLGWVLTEHFEGLVLLGSGAIDGTGNAAHNNLQGNAGANDLFGLGGNDTIDGNGGDDVVDGGAGFDTLSGGDGDDELHGGAGGDFLSGGDGNDYLHDDGGVGELWGGDGDDIMIGRGPMIGGEGYDTFTFLEYTPPTFIPGPGRFTPVFRFDVDFSAGEFLDLRLIDFDSVTAGDQAPTLVSAFGGVAGQMIKRAQGFYVDVNGDRITDVIIAVSPAVRDALGNTYTGPGDTDGGWLL